MRICVSIDVYLACCHFISCSRAGRGFEKQSVVCCSLWEFLVGATARNCADFDGHKTPRVVAFVLRGSERSETRLDDDQEPASQKAAESRPGSASNENAGLSRASSEVSYVEDQHRTGRERLNSRNRRALSDRSWSVRCWRWDCEG